ncbi:MAG: DegT/DnrJ/EryC1/StrS family aminotransferase [Verrucomicrobiae bacterium]|nr:DegT/DnrJ/EryC1/StrS family aminotransferase [Verrucomicrobiae bacterium]
MSQPSVPFLDLQAQHRQIRDEVFAAWEDICQSCRFAQGPPTQVFEREFAAYCGTQHCVSCNSGTSALHLALRVLDIGPGDEVITVPMTFIATVWAISYVGARPVFVDIEPGRRTLDPARLEAAITPRTRAILPVHLYGMPADMAPIQEIAARHQVPVIEDAAQAHGARYRGRRAGQWSRIACFSFYPGKNLGAYGEGGALVTDDEALAARARRLREHGQSRRYYHEELGYNYRMDSLQAAVLSAKLKRLEAWNAARQALARRYDALLAGLPVTRPAFFADTESVWHLYVIECERRDEVRERLAAAGVETGLHYPVPVHLQQAYAHLGHQPGDFPHSEALAQRCLSLPMFAEMTEAQQQRVVEALAAALK